MANKAVLSAGHEERFRAEGTELVVLKAEENKPRRFKATAYTGVDVGRFWGRMVINSSGIQRGKHTAMLVEHNDGAPVGVADEMEVDKTGKVSLSGYLLSEKASEGRSSHLMALADEGFPLKMSVGVRFLKHHDLEEGAEEEINGRKFAGPMTVIDECHLFETSFIHASPADLATEATVMRAAQEKPMALPQDPNTTSQGASLSEDEKEKLRREGVERERSAVKAKEEALKSAFPKRPKFVARMLAAGKTLDEAREHDRVRSREKLAEVRAERRAQEKLAQSFAHVGAGHTPGTGTLELDAKFAGMTLEQRVDVEVLDQPILRDLWGDESKRALLSLHKTKDRRSTSGQLLLGGNARTALSIDHMGRDLIDVARALQHELGHAVGPITLERIEQFGIAKVGPDLGRITVKGFIGTFYSAYEESLSGNVFSKVSYQLQSDQETEIVRWLAAPPQLQEWKGPRVAKGLQIYTQLLQNKLFETTVRVDKWHFQQQKFDLINKSFGNYGGVTSQHWDQIFAALLEANTTSYDTFNFFSKTHTLGGDSGTMTNDLTSGQGFNSLAIADPQLPTQIEAARILMQCTPHAQDFKWANGINMNGTAAKWLVLVPTKWKSIFQAAVSSERLDTGQTNPIYAMKEQFEVAALPYLTATNPYIYLLRLDTPNSPFLRAEPQPITMLWQGPGSHFEFVEHCYAMGLESVRGLANGAWESAMRLTLGAAA